MDRFVRILRALLLALAGLAALALLGGLAFYFAQPSSFAFSRSIVVPAAPASVHAHLDDLRAFEAWQPWPPTDPAHPPRVTFSEPASGVGAWIDRRDAAGEGARTTIVSITDARVEMQNETSGGFAQGHSTQSFDLRAVPSGTEVTWTFGGELSGLARVLWPFVGLEGRVGPRMDEALRRLSAASAAGG
ncbi:MAG: SRPBCC family protein [Sandaracinus sp.]